MFKQKKDYIKKKYKDVPPLNIGDVNRILQQYSNDDEKFRMFTSILEIQQQYNKRSQQTNIEEILRNNVQRLVELYGDADINIDALNNMYKNIDQTQNIEEQIQQLEFSKIYQGDHDSQLLSINQTIDRYDHYLNVIQTKLSKNIFSNYSSYLEALHHIDQIGTVSESLILKVRISRHKIQQVQQILLSKSKTILQKRKQIQDLQSLIQQMQKVKQLYVKPYETFVLSMQNGYIDASAFLPTIINIEIMEGLDLIPKNYKEDRIEYVRQITCKGLIDQFMNYDEQLYKIHYNSYHFMELNNIVQPYQQVTNLLIMKAFEAKLHVVFDQISEILSIDFYFDNLTDSLNQITKDQLTEFYRELCCQTIYFLMNLHLIIRFHLESLQDERMIEIRKFVYSKVFDRICEIIDQTPSWSRMSKEDLVIFFGMLTILIAKCEVFGGQNLEQYKEFIQNKFSIYLSSREHKVQIKQLLIDEDCKKCLKITLNQTQMILQIANKSQKFYVFEYKDPFPDTFNVFKSIEFKKVIDLLLGTNSPIKKQNASQSIIFQGKERNLFLTQTVNQIYVLMQQNLLYIHFFPNHADELANELTFIINYYIYTFSMQMILDEHQRHMFQDVLNFIYDTKQEPEQFTQQFEHISQVYIFREKYGDVIRYFKNISIPEDLKVQKKQAFDLMDRVVFLESIIFLINEFSYIKDNFVVFQPYYKELYTIMPQLQELVIRGCVNHEPFAQLVSCKYEIKQTDKDDLQRIQLIDKIITTNEVKLVGLSSQQLSEVQKIYYDEVLYLFALVYSRIKKITQFGRETMLNDYLRASKTYNAENNLYLEYIKIYNQIQVDVILEYINNHQKIFPFKMLLGLFFTQVMQTQKKQQRKEQIFKIFQNYQQ